MNKSSKAKSTKNSSKNRAIERARKQFYSNLFDMSWRLVLALLLPLLIGAYLDGSKGGGDTYTLLGLVVGTALAVYVIIRQYRKLKDEVDF